MIAFFIRRFFWMVLTVWVVFTITWILANSTPGTPFDKERDMPPAVRQNIMRRYNLHLPPTQRYLIDLGKTATGDLGTSLKMQDYTVNRVVSQCWPVSAALGLMALALAMLVGLSSGIVSAARRGSIADVSLMAVATIGIALPNFVIAGFAIILFCFLVPLLPPAGWGSPQTMILPALCLGAPYAAYIARITRTGMLDVLGQDFIRTARAKGLSEWDVIIGHALPIAVIPVVSFLGPAVAGIITGSLVVEKIFGIPGLGYAFIESALNKDIPMALGLTVLFTVLLFTMNTLVDFAYSLLDPRVEWTT